MHCQKHKLSSDQSTDLSTSEVSLVSQLINQSLVSSLSNAVGIDTVSLSLFLDGIKSAPTPLLRSVRGSLLVLKLAVFVSFSIKGECLRLQIWPSSEKENTTTDQAPQDIGVIMLSNDLIANSNIFAKNSLDAE